MEAVNVPACLLLWRASCCQAGMRAAASQPSWQACSCQPAVCKHAAPGPVLAFVKRNRPCAVLRQTRLLHATLCAAGGFRADAAKWPGGGVAAYMSRVVDEVGRRDGGWEADA